MKDDINSIKKKTGLAAFIHELIKQKWLIFLIIPGVVSIFIFNYIPMYGVIIAFQRYSPIRGIIRSEWVGLYWFEYFFSNPFAVRTLRNTLLLGFFGLIVGFPLPIILTLFLNELRSMKFKRVVQTISYLPYFISVVIIVGMLKEFTGVNGMINNIIKLLGVKPIAFFVRPEWFRTLYIGSGIWQGLGWGTILYLAAITNINPELYESADLDGASRWQKSRYITLPGLRPTIVILLIFSVGGILGTDFMKVLLMYSPAIYSTADVVGTYTYREGLVGGNFSYAAAVGLFMSVFSCILLVITNYIARKTSETSLW